MSKFNRTVRKIYWYLSAKYASLAYPIPSRLPYLAVTGTDGKTTTCSFLYEIAKASGYKPFLLTTVSAKFNDENIETKLKSSSFFAYSVNNAFSNLRHYNFTNFFKNILFLDRRGYEETEEEHRTTPLNSEIRKFIREYYKKGANLFIIETTSHALDQYRVLGIKFSSIVFTNITNEHLDYHGTWENYASAKATLIRQLKKGGYVSINKNDPQSFEFLKKKIDEIKKFKNINQINYSAEKNIDRESFWINFSGNEDLIQVSAIKDNVIENSYQTRINIFGDYNIFNALGAVSCFLGFMNQEISNSSQKKKKSILTKITSAVSNLENVEGRMNFISTNPTIIVDFAHTPNAMEQALKSARELRKRTGKLWVIFGTAGLRDKYKRPAMGKIAYDFADNILITAEDPRTESLHEINDEIISGFKNTDEEFVINNYYPELVYERSARKFIVRFDEPNLNSRTNAIHFALKNMKKNDVIILLGKGHERSICFGTTEYRWSDIEEVKKVLAN